jgi:hypothetical protein
MICHLYTKSDGLRSHDAIIERDDICVHGGWGDGGNLNLVEICGLAEDLCKTDTLFSEAIWLCLFIFRFTDWLVGMTLWCSHIHRREF